MHKIMANFGVHNFPEKITGIPLATTDFYVFAVKNHSNHALPQEAFKILNKNAMSATKLSQN